MIPAVENPEAWRCTHQSCAAPGHCHFGPLLRLADALRWAFDPGSFVWMGAAPGRADLGCYDHPETARHLIMDTAGHLYEPVLLGHPDRWEYRPLRDPLAYIEWVAGVEET